MAPLAPPVLHGPTVTLRPPCREDIETRRRLGLHPEIEWGLGRTIHQARELTPDEALAWYRRATDGSDAASWIIEVDGSMAGVTRLHTLIPTEQRAAFAITLMRPDHLGKGLGSQAINLVLAHAFDTLRLHRVSLRVLARNTRALTAYRRAGFVIEGRERETIRVDGTWQDDLMMGILAHEYTSPTPNTTAHPT